MRGQISNINFVSTYSRPKAAGIVTTTYLERVESFNSQPPEGGWHPIVAFLALPAIVSTHSRAKAAGYVFVGAHVTDIVSTHSRAKAAGCGMVI